MHLLKKEREKKQKTGFTHLLRKLNRSMVIKSELYKAKNRAFTKWKTYCDTLKKLETERNLQQSQIQFNQCLNEFVAAKEAMNLKTDFDFDICQFKQQASTNLNTYPLTEILKSKTHGTFKISVISLCNTDYDNSIERIAIDEIKDQFLGVQLDRVQVDLSTSTRPLFKGGYSSCLLLLSSATDLGVLAAHINKKAEKLRAAQISLAVILLNSPKTSEQILQKLLRPAFESQFISELFIH